MIIPAVQAIPGSDISLYGWDEYLSFHFAAGDTDRAKSEVYLTSFTLYYS